MYLQLLGVVPDYAVLSVVLLCIIEAEVEIILDCLETWVTAMVYFLLDFIERDRLLDEPIVIRILSLRRSSQEVQ